MNIAFMIASLGPGGAERVATTLCNAWSGLGHAVTIITMDDHAIAPFYELKPQVVRIGLGISGNSPSLVGSFRINFAIIKALRRTLKQVNPHCAISFIDATNVRLILANLGLGIPTIISERIYPMEYSIPKIWRLMRKISYPLASVLVVQTARAKLLFSGALDTRTMVIPNPVNCKPLFINSEPEIELTGATKIVAMGRLATQKRFDILIKAFSRIDPRHKATLTILGEGPLRSQLEQLRDNLGLTETVFFPGLVRYPPPVLRQADIFVLSSEFEGFPNALVEAMACGLPVVSFDCAAGPSDIIRHNVDGLLVPPLAVGALAEAMEYLLLNESERKRLATRAADVRSRFSIDSILELWDRAILKAVNYKKDNQVNS